MVETYWIRGLSHIGLLTDDPKKAVDFYHEHLGFQLIYEKTLDNGTECWFAENGGLVLEFVKKSNVPAPTAPGPIYHVALEVCGMDALVAELKEKGIMPADAKPNSNASFFPSGIKNVFFDGPCGEYIELFELAHD